MNITLHHTDVLTPDTTMFWFEPSEPFTYTSGQFISLSLPHDKPDERGMFRWFSLSSAPTEQYLAITTRFASHQGSTFKQALRALQPGAALTMTGPMGTFTLPADPAVPLVFVVGGIGITPLRSMMRWLNDQNDHRNITLLYSVATFQQIIFMDEIERQGANCIPVVFTPPEGWTGQTGQLDAARILQLSGNQAGALYYISGPKPMVQALGAGLAQTGLAPEQIRTDAFSGYTSI